MNLECYDSRVSRSFCAHFGCLRRTSVRGIERQPPEPMVIDPIYFDWSADGRLWVVEMRDYPLGIDGRGKPGGAIRVLEDTDGDGRYDKSSVFMENVNFPTGLMPWRNGILVCAPPDVFYSKDKDGDGKSDQIEKLFTGFGEGNQQHRANGFVYGLDNWVYGANGDSGGNIRSLKKGTTTNISGRDFRFRPEDGSFETVSGKTQFGRNGDEYSGMLVSETANTIVLANPTGARETLSRSDIVSLTSTRKSLMPDGFEQFLKPQDLADGSPPTKTVVGSPGFRLPAPTAGLLHCLRRRPIPRGGARSSYECQPW